MKQLHTIYFTKKRHEASYLALCLQLLPSTFGRGEKQGGRDELSSGDGVAVN